MASDANFGYLRLLERQLERGNDFGLVFHHRFGFNRAMKKQSVILVLSWILFATLFSAEPVSQYSGTAATELVEAACKKAAAETKLVFLKSGHPQCGWCVVFDRFHHKPEVQQIIEKYYVVAAIDIVNMPNGAAVFERFAKVGAPSWVIITPERKALIDSYDNGSNVGYPLQPNETAYYLAALKKATPAITDAELTILAEQIKKAAGK